MATQWTLARLLLRRLVITSFVAGLMIGIVIGYVGKMLEGL